METISIKQQLASSLGKRDETPNTELANAIAQSADKAAVKELVTLLKDKSKDIQSDCIKVLYEIGEQAPALIAEYHCDFIELLGSKDNRMVWGAMTALDTIAPVRPKDIFTNIITILDASDNGSVITKDHAVGILIKLAGIKLYADNCQQLLLGQLAKAAPNQLPMYAENALPVMPGVYQKEFVAVLTHRLNDMEKESKRKRVEKVLNKLNGKKNS